MPLHLSQPITGSLASQYWTSSLIGVGPIYSVKMLRSTALKLHFFFGKLPKARLGMSKSPGSTQNAKHYRLTTTHYILLTAHCTLHTAHYRLHTAHCPPPPVRHPGEASPEEVCLSAPGSWPQTILHYDQVRGGGKLVMEEVSKGVGK